MFVIITYKNQRICMIVRLCGAALDLPAIIHAFLRRFEPVR